MCEPLLILAGEPVSQYLPEPLDVIFFSQWTPLWPLFLRGATVFFNIGWDTYCELEDLDREERKRKAAQSETPTQTKKKQKKLDLEAYGSVVSCRVQILMSCRVVSRC